MHLPLTDQPSVKFVIKKTFLAFMRIQWKLVKLQLFILKLYQIQLNPNEEQKSYLIDTFNREFVRLGQVNSI